MPHRIAQLSYSNKSDYCRWDLTSLENHSVPSVRSIPWRTAWFLETAPPKNGQRVLYLSFERHRDFENRFIRKCFREKLESSVTIMLASPIQDKVDLTPQFFEVQHHPLGQNLPFQDASFDRIYCANILNLIHPTQQERYLRDVARLLKSGGIFCLSAAYLVKARVDSETQEIRGFSPIPHYMPNVKRWLDALDIPYPYNAANFPGFATFDEDKLLYAEDLLIDGMDRFPPYSERDQSLSLAQLGLSITSVI